MKSGIVVSKYAVVSSTVIISLVGIKVYSIKMSVVISTNDDVDTTLVAVVVDLNVVVGVVVVVGEVVKIVCVVVIKVVEIEVGAVKAIVVVSQPGATNPTACF